MSRPKDVPVQPAGNSPKNIVVFGEGGVGKSSLINLIAGRSITATSGSAKGCTFQHTQYAVRVSHRQYAIWDTAGLDEDSYGSVPAEVAEGNLKLLLDDLVKANGIHLVIYCVRPSSHLRKTLLSNYNLFYSAICRKKVPIVVVVTGLENYDGEMEAWWAANEPEFAKLKMHFDGHACVTTLNAQKVNSPILKQRCKASRKTVLEVIASKCARDDWGTEQEGRVSAALADTRAMFKAARQNGPQTTVIVAHYDLPEQQLDPIGSPKDQTPFEGRLMDVGGTPLIVYRIGDEQLLAGSRFKKQISPRGADLLIFCASVRTTPEGWRGRVAAFYGSYGGETRPLLVVGRDALRDEMARDWWNNGLDEQTGKCAAIVRALPPPESACARVAVAKVQKSIQTRSLRPVELSPSGSFTWLGGGKRVARLPSGGTRAFVQEDTLTKWKVWVPWSPP